MWIYNIIKKIINSASYLLIFIGVHYQQDKRLNKPKDTKNIDSTLSHFQLNKVIEDFQLEDHVHQNSNNKFTSETHNVALGKAIKENIDFTLHNLSANTTHDLHLQSSDVQPSDTLAALLYEEILLGNNLKKIEFILSQGLNVNSAYFLEKLPLHAAIYQNSLKIVKLLLNHGANPNGPQRDGKLPLYISIKLAEKGNNQLKIAEALLEHGADFKEASQGSVLILDKALSIAANDQYPEVLDLLCKYGATVNSKNQHGELYLSEAMRMNDFKKIELLLARGADPNIFDNQNFLPLHEAIRKRQFKIVQLLLTRGADPNIFDNQNKLPLQIAIYQSNDSIHRPNELLEIIKLLLEKGADPNRIEKNQEISLSPLQIAINLHFLDLVKLLLEYKANPNVLQENGELILASAIRANNLELVKILLEQGANPNLAEKNGRLCLPLSIAIYNHQIEITEMLLQYGANIKKAHLKSDLLLKNICENKSLRTLLLKYGADLRI